MDSRTFSIGELLLYLTVFCVVCGAWCCEDADILFFPTLFLTGAVVGGPIGLVVGGREWFFPAALTGAAILALIPLTMAILLGLVFT